MILYTTDYIFMFYLDLSIWLLKKFINSVSCIYLLIYKRAINWLN